MSSRSINALVRVNRDEPVSRAIQRFKRQCRNSGMYHRTKKHFISKSEKKRQRLHLIECRKRKRNRKNELINNNYGKKETNTFSHR